MFEKTIVIKSYDVDPDGYVKASALQKYMQQIGREDCNLFGYTYEYMRSAGSVFVLTRLTLEYYENIVSGDIVTVKSINNRIEGATYIREFLYYRNKKLVAASTTHWVLLDFIKRTIIRPSLCEFNLPAMNIPDIGLKSKRRLSDKTTVFDIIGETAVRFSDLDENNHMNNSIYSDIITDFAPCDLYNYKISHLQINFAAEAKLGETLIVSHSKLDSGFIIKADIAGRSLNCFEAEVTLKQK